MKEQASSSSEQALSSAPFGGDFSRRFLTDQTQIFLDKVIHWAETNPDIIGLALVGSHARDQVRADSDIDLVLLTARPQDFVDNSKWVSQFGRVKTFEIESWGKVTSLRVHYEQGIEVEFGLTLPDWASVPLDEGTRRVVSDGMKVLVDKQGLLSRALTEGSK